MRWKLLAGIVAMLLVATMPAGVMGAGEINKNARNLSYTILLEKPRIEDKGKYILVDLKGSTDEETAFYMETGKPIIPIVAKTFFFPLGTKINKVNVNIERKSYTLEKKIEPAPKPAVLLPNAPVEPEAKPDPSVYGSDNLYPEGPYKIRYGVGIENGERVLIVNIKCYAQYSPARNVIYVPERIDISIDYSLPEKPLFTASTYDLLIITHEKFAPYLEPLVKHKNSMGIKTLVETVQEIYEKYPIGCAGTKELTSGEKIPIPRDKPEQIKYAIKDAIEKYGIKYVLIIGGRKGQTLDWWVPDRLSWNVAEDPKAIYCDFGYSTELYFADIYRPHPSGRGVIFDDWDTNNNGRIAEGSYWGIPDKPDYYPDVYVGRIPARSTWEVKVAVDKIIHYEKDAGSWFKKAVMVSGDTFPPSRGASKPVYEGERECDKAANYLKRVGFVVEKLYTSRGNFNSYEDVMHAIGNGVGFVYTAGHGNPSVWGNFLPMAQTEDEFVYGHTVFDIWRYSNEHYVFIVIGGCHNSQFNISGQYFIDYLITGNMSKHVRLSEHYPYCDGYWWLLDRDGGAIGSIGNTALGYGYINEYSTEGLGGWLEPRFFYAYALEKKHRMGEMWARGITDYINLIDNVETDMIDRKTIEECVLMGDPSILLGGSYAPAEKEKSEVKESNGAISATPAEIPTWEKGMTWIFNVTSIDLTLNNVENRYVDIHIKTGDLKLEVTDVTADYYELSFSLSNATACANVNFDLMFEGVEPIKIWFDLKEINVDGELYLDKSTMGIVKASINIKCPLYLKGLPLELFNLTLPSWIVNLVDSTYPLRLNATINVDLSNPYPIVSFPLAPGNVWGLPATSLNIEVQGNIKSLWLRVAKILDSIMEMFGKDLIPTSFEKLLPIIKLPDLLEMLGIPSEKTIDLPGISGYVFRDFVAFKCEKVENITVLAGNFSAYKIFSVRHIGEYWYSPEAKMFVMAKGNFNGLCPVVNDFVLELKEIRGV